jgi:hypothetical protein
MSVLRTHLSKQPVPEFLSESQLYLLLPYPHSEASVLHDLQPNAVYEKMSIVYTLARGADYSEEVAAKDSSSTA